jgi:hypothetical protein
MEAVAIANEYDQWGLSFYGEDPTVLFDREEDAKSVLSQMGQSSSVGHLVKRTVYETEWELVP